MNCFHFSVSLGYKTTTTRTWANLQSLWIAFIFQYLWDTKQQTSPFKIKLDCCELLSFFSIFGIQNNITQRKSFTCQVVNCFHFSVSLGYKTTYRYYFTHCLMLWIAFIFQYLWDTKQQIKDNGNNTFCCELLSFFSIFGIQNNKFKQDFWVDRVVNCFHFSVSLGYKTTGCFKI